MHDGLKIILGEEELWLSSRRCLWWPRRRTLVVSDLHLGKGIDFTSRGCLLPPYDTTDTLERLRELISEFRPQQVICLGDNFHRSDSFYLLGECEKQMIQNLVESVPQWAWVNGNHDAELPSALLGIKARSINENPFNFYHEPQPNISRYIQIVGHFHPKYTTNLKENRISKPCFAWSENILIMPSFGSYTGGLSISNSEILKVLGKAFKFATANTRPKPILFASNQLSLRR